MRSQAAQFDLLCYRAVCWHFLTIVHYLIIYNIFTMPGLVTLLMPLIVRECTYILLHLLSVSDAIVGADKCT